MTKVKKFDPLPEEGFDDYRLYSAKNEGEDFAFVLRCDESIPDVNVEFSDFENESGDKLSAKLFREYYVETKAGEFIPDAVAAQSGAFALAKNENQPMLIAVTTDAGTAAGDYTASLRICGAGRELYEGTLSLHVWDFALPDRPACATAVGLYSESINRMHELHDPERQSEMYRRYYDFLLEHRVSAYNLPYDILDARCDAYLSDPRVTSFVIPCDDDEKLRSYYEKLSKNPEWLKKGTFYPLDEPTSKAHVDTLRQKVEHIRSLFPDCRIVTPFFRCDALDGERDYVDLMCGITNVWCPKSYMFDSANVYSAKQLAQRKPFGDRMKERTKSGDELWWYVCWEPGYPYLNLFVDMSGLDHRLLFWQQKLYGVTGFLYWGANYWNGTNDPWSDMRTVKDLSMDVFGDGSLLYNGNKIGIDGPCGSLRLNCIRDGIDDMAMLDMAQQLLGEDFVSDIITEVTSSLTEYTRSEDTFAAARIKLGCALEDASQLANAVIL